MFLHDSNPELALVSEEQKYMQIKSYMKCYLQYKELAKSSTNIDDIDMHNFSAEEFCFLIYFLKDSIDDKDTIWVTVGYITLLEDYNEILRKSLGKKNIQLRSNKEIPFLVLDIESQQYRLENNLETIKQLKLCIGVK